MAAVYDTAACLSQDVNLCSRSSHNTQPISTSPQATVNSMDSTSWEQIKSRYKLGQFVQGKVEFHAPFGVFVNIDESLLKGLIKIPDFLDEGEMSEEMYPEIGTTVGAVVVGYNESNCREIYLNAKPSVLHRALVPLKIPTLAV
jgi:ribosomal protein S1